MKLFLSDWNSEHAFVADTEEKKEYPINSWLSSGDGKQVYMVSAYLYDKSIMFLYIYDLSYHPENKEKYVYIMPETYRESLEQSKRFNRQFRFNVRYEVNDLNTGCSFRTCLPLRADEIEPRGEPEFDKFTEMRQGEYDYLCNLMKETDRIPKALRDKELAFGKCIVSLDECDDEIKNIAIYQPEYISNEYEAETTFTVPYGECEVCVPYTISDTGEENYFTVRELKFHDMSHAFDERYEELKKAREDMPEDSEIDHGRMDFEEMRSMYNVTILTISIQQSIKERSFNFFTKERLDTKMKVHTTGIGGSFTVGCFFFSEEGSETDGTMLYKRMYSLGEVDGEPKDEYEITLISVTDILKAERKALLELRFDECEEG